MYRLVATVKSAMYHVAGFIDFWTKGLIKPAHITTLSVLGHFFVVWSLVVNKPILAAVLLVVFGLMDSLDGALARYQNSTSLSGMFFDAVSDRIKEVILYSGLAVYLYKFSEFDSLWLIVALCGTSILVSYTKAKGEMAISGSKSDPQKINRLFSVGFASYEIRMAVIIAGLLFGIIELFIPLLVAANLLTIALRFIVISRELFLIDQKNLEKKTSK